jgi:hypothetical protein
MHQRKRHTIVPEVHFVLIIYKTVVTTMTWWWLWEKRGGGGGGGGGCVSQSVLTRNFFDPIQNKHTHTHTAPQFMRWIK